MSLRFYLAMTEAEIRSSPVLPRHLAYMACHFSPYGNGLVNIPERLPPESLLIVNDRVPVLDHNPDKIAKQLLDAVRKLRVFGILLDFQIPGNPQTAQIVKKVTETLTCPVCVSEQYSCGLSCPILCAPPVYQSLKDYISSKKSRPVWLETFQETALLTVTSDGCETAPGENIPGKYFFDETLQCKYQFTLQKDSVCFTLCRQAEDIPRYLHYAESLGIEVAVGLYQQFRGMSF